MAVLLPLIYIFLFVSQNYTNLLVINSKRTFIRMLTLVVIFLITAAVAHANEIDKLKTNEDVQKFLIEKVNPKWAKYNFFEVADSTDTSPYAKGKFLKLDLDNNGLTDLIINSTYLFAITDSGNGHFNVHFIDRGAFMSDKYTLKNVIYKENLPLLVVGKYNQYYVDGENNKNDTLILKFDNFYEYTSTPDNFSVQEINFSTTPCFGSCPIFELAIKGDRTAKYDAQEYNDKTGKFEATIDTASFAELIQTINYLKLLSLKDEYRVHWTDDQTVTLKIKLNNGRIKEISDYGKIGTFGLKVLYDQLFALRKTQAWK